MFRVGLFLKIVLILVEKFIEIRSDLVIAIVLGSIGVNNIDVEFSFEFNLLPLRTNRFQCHFPSFLLFIFSV